MTTEAPSRILIVDDHPVMRLGLKTLVEVEKDLEVVAEAGDAAEAMELLQKYPDLDLAIIDVALPGRSGLELLKDIRMEYPDLKCLVISSHDEEVYAERVLRAGGRGYVMKDRAPEQLIDAITQVLGGGVFLSQTMTLKLMEQFAGGKPGSAISTLTDRELEVFCAIGEGKSSREIAGKLNISIRTIDAHRTHIKEKLGVRDAAELTYYAIRWVESQA